MISDSSLAGRIATFEHDRKAIQAINRECEALYQRRLNAEAHCVESERQLLQAVHASAGIVLAGSTIYEIAHVGAIPRLVVRQIQVVQIP